MAVENVFLSLIIPAHNEAARLPQTLDEIRKFFLDQPYQAEVIVVENGSTDETLKIAQDWQADWPDLIVISLKEGGKGNAVRAGMLAASGEYRFMADTDLSMPIEQVARFLPPVRSEDIAIASREALGSRRIDEPLSRHWIGRIFNMLVRLLVLPGLQDSQCGFKCFSARAAEQIFPKQTLKGWSFDVEVLAIGQQMGFKVVEVPIDWTYQKGSRVKVVRDSFRMLRDLLLIRRNLKQGLYDGKAL